MKRIVKVFLYLVVFFAAALFVLFVHLASLGPAPVILMYHSVGADHGDKTSLDVPVDVFERQMNFLLRHGYRVIRLTDMADKIRRAEKLASRTVVLTFDDGYDNNYTNAFPILKKYGFPATIFLIASQLGQDYPVAEGVPARLMIKEMVREMAESGLIDFGSHTLRHPFLPDIRDPKRLHEEIVVSKILLEKIAGRSVKTFCYPVGGYSGSLERLVKKAGYEAAVTTGNHRGVNGDLFALRRIKIKKTDPVSLFVQLSGYYYQLKEI